MSIGITGIRQGSTGAFHPDKHVDKRTFADALVTGDTSAGFQEAMTELRRDTVETILRVARTEQVAKVVSGDEPVYQTVRGFATFLRFIKGKSLSELEDTLGFEKNASLRNGAHIYIVDRFSLDLSNVVPEGYTDWSDGVAPIELHKLTEELRRRTNDPNAKVTYDPKYPAAKNPIIQFRILDDVPYIGQPRFVKPGEVV